MISILYQTSSFCIFVTTIKVTINEKSGKGKHLLALLREMSRHDKDIRVENLFEPNEETNKAINDAESGNTIVCEDFEDYLAKIKD